MYLPQKYVLVIFKTTMKRRRSKHETSSRMSAQPPTQEESEPPMFTAEAARTPSSQPSPSELAHPSCKQPS
jgi:hypothetical protein